MKKFAFLFCLCALWLEARPRDLIKYVPERSFLVIGADFQQLRGNDIYTSMERKGQIWSYEQESDVTYYFNKLKIKPERDIRDFVFSKYLNSYGNGGELYFFDLNRDAGSLLSAYPSQPYLDSSLYRIDPNDDRYATSLGPQTIVFGGLNEVKMAVDTSHNKVGNMTQNPELFRLFGKVPEQAAVWGAALPLSRREAAAANAKQSTNAALKTFQNYYFYGLPSKTTAKGHFFGETGDEREAVLVQTFMVGTVAIAKFRVNEDISDMLDQVTIERNGRVVHVTGVVTKEMVDAYFNHDLGVD